jgi:allantoin racemase
MRILVINPNTTGSMTEAIGVAARQYALPSTEVECVSAPWGPRSIEGHFEEVLAAAATVEVVAANRKDFDAFVIACYGDPGLFAAREIADVPVLGIAEASMLTACTLAHRFSVVTVIPRIVPMLHDLVRRYGMESRCASIRSSGLGVLELDEDPARAVEEIVAQAQMAIDGDGAEAIALGCAGMGPLDKTVQGRLGVPVIDGVAAAVKLCEALTGYGVSTSKVAAFKSPEEKELIGVAAALQEVTAR